MNHVLKETRIDRVLKDRIGGIEQNFILFSDGRYALALEDYVLADLDPNRDVVIPTFYNDASGISKGPPILDKLYVIRNGIPRPQLPKIDVQDISVVGYVDYYDKKLKLITYLSEVSRIAMLCEAYGEQWSVSFECHENSAGVKAEKCTLKCYLPISSSIEKYVGIVDYNINDGVKTDVVLSSVCSSAGIDHGIYADKLLADDPDAEIEIDKNGLKICKSSYHVDSLTFDEDGGVVIIKNIKTGKIVYNGRI